jgi:hypothetical protein
MNNTFYVLDDHDGFFSSERRRLEEVLALATFSNGFPPCDET